MHFECIRLAWRKLGGKTESHAPCLQTHDSEPMTWLTGANWSISWRVTYFPSEKATASRFSNLYGRNVSWVFLISPFTTENELQPSTGTKVISRRVWNPDQIILYQLPPPAIFLKPFCRWAHIAETQMHPDEQTKFQDNMTCSPKDRTEAVAEQSQDCPAESGAAACQWSHIHEQDIFPVALNPSGASFSHSYCLSSGIGILS